jgi:uncharacterized protein YdeI (YjbR/CyaY-like superfamily)
MREPVFFASAEELRQWFAEHHDSADELQIGFYRRASGHGGISYQEAVDAALCYGWIDGIRHGIDEESYTTRFTPRRKRSIWSQVNLRRVEELRRQGLMAEPGLRAYEARDPARTGLHSSENRRELEGEELEALKANPAAWDFWQAQPPGYRRTASWWVLSAKREETRGRRLAVLIADSAGGRRIGAVT